ncbi:TolC family protein [Deinococcus rubellus]|uniref:TolC family protein n=1 Tax=Deinococcus rubellus TaxID=1889240 RepID=A0ABY5YKW5_9DEIO|nr:TolC family protein [Deinococcus rubellus]UWX65341.1 TolC family protein [Deinococcus rubellus]
MNFLPRPRSSRTAALTAWLLCAALTPALAQTTAPPDPAPITAPAPPTALSNAVLTFADVQRAIRGSAGWRSAEEQYKAAQYALDSARARVGLDLTLGGSVSAGKSPVDSGDWQAVSTLTGQVSAAVLPWGSAFDGVRSAERALGRAALDLQDSRQTLLLGAAQSYLSAQLAAEQETLNAAQAALASQQLGVAQDQRQNNLISVEDLLTRQGNLESAQASAVNAQAAREIGERQLLSDAGLDVGLAARLILPSVPSIPGAPAPLADLLASALGQRSEIQKAASQLTDARASLTSAQRERLPDLSASVNYGQLSLTGSGGRSVGGSLNVKTGVAAATFSLPTSTGSTPIPTSLSLGLTGSFDVLGGAANAAIASAQSSVRSAELALESARSSVELGVRRAYNDALNTRRLLDVQRTALTRAQMVLTSAQARLTAGLGTALDVNVAQVGVQNAQFGVDQALNAAYLAQVQLAKASAQFDPALLLVSISPDSSTPTSK